MSIVIVGTVIGSGVGNGNGVGVAVKGGASATLDAKTNVKKAMGRKIDVRNRKIANFDVYHLLPLLPPLVASVGGLGGGLPGPSV